jgi:hypothetical protein
MNEIDKIVYQAKLAEQAERYDEMVRLFTDSPRAPPPGPLAAFSARRRWLMARFQRPATHLSAPAPRTRAARVFARR